MQIGIDIGTHTARAAYLSASGQPRLVRMPGGGTQLAALARQTMHGLIVGDEAARALVGNAETTIAGCTRLMGRAGSLPRELLARLPYEVREIGGEVACNLLYAEVRPSQVYAAIVRALCDAAAAELGAPIDEVVLTVPAGAEDRFRIQARAAVEALGLRVRRLINQPTAALLALHAQERPARRPTTIAVVGCAGGVTEVSLAQQGPSGTKILAVAADTLLGGDDMAWAVARQLGERFRTAAGIDVLSVGDSCVAAQGLRTAAGELLEALDERPELQLTIDHGGGFGRDLVTVVRRADVDVWLSPALATIAELCRRALASAGLAPAQVARVVLIGEWAHLACLREAVASAFGRTVADLHTADAEALAAYGAALAGAAGGASVWDVTPYPLGINCYYGEEELFSPIVRANTTIPTPAVGQRGALTEQYQTRYPDQTSVRIDVLQYRGPRDADPYGVGRVRATECECLGSWEFAGLRPRRGHHAGFTVTFAIDGDGILQLAARETDTGHTLSARVERGLGEGSG